MVSTRSTKRRSRSPPATIEQERPKKIVKTPEKPKSAPKQSLDGVKVVLLDIEGTICPITFVKDTLFPYAISALPDYLSTHWTDESFKTQHLAAFPPEHAASPDALTAHVQDLTARDVKAPYLKALQGTLWDAGYRAGAYAAPVYADVLAFLDRWADDARPAAVTAAESEGHTDQDGHEGEGKKTLKVAIYSSGSVGAQKLFFEHIATPAASQTDEKAPKVQDRRPAITAWFDTVNAGPKQQSASYTSIAASLGHQDDPAEILFLSDNVAEVRAALAAGMESIVVEREGNAPLSDQDRAELEVVTSFEQLDLK